MNITLIMMILLMMTTMNDISNQLASQYHAKPLLKKRKGKISKMLILASTFVSKKINIIEKYFLLLTFVNIHNSLKLKWCLKIFKKSKNWNFFGERLWFLIFYTLYEYINNFEYINNTSITNYIFKMMS